LSADPAENVNLYNIPAFRQKQLALTVKLLDRIILENDKEPLLQAKTADKYGEHSMYYQVWKKEFDAIV
jgi:hypothetical protein